LKKILYFLPLITTLLFSFNNNLQIDQIINKKVINIFYNYKVKGPIVVTYKTDKNSVNSENIDKRPRFYSEKNLQKQYRTNPKDYIYCTSKNNLDREDGRIIRYDRGHLAPDASFDYSVADLRKIYTMANIIPQVSEVNRKTWIKSERLERRIAQKMDLNVIILVMYTDLQNNLVKIPMDKLDTHKWKTSKKRKYEKYSRNLNSKNIIVPTGFYRILENKNKNYFEILYYTNEPTDVKQDRLKNHRISEVEKNKVLTYLRKIGVNYEN
jgi:endonuclease G